MTGLNPLKILLCLAILCTSGLRHTALAQYQQKLTPDRTNGVFKYTFKPTSSSAAIDVVDLGPTRVIALYYNCFYMKEICTNIDNFKLTTRGRAIYASGGNNSPARYTFDFSKRRKKFRRTQMCPSSWKRNHPCPEPNQDYPMRHDGVWIFRDLEQGTSVNAIRNSYYLNGNLREASKIRYTCDEFPAASWVEGGTGEGKDSPGTTRCAAQQCRPGAKAEQNWQGSSHKILRQELNATAFQRPPNTQPILDSNSVAFFNHYTEFGPTMIAARVVVFDATGAQVKESNIIQGFRKRVDNGTYTTRNDTIGRLFEKGLWNLSGDELDMLVNSGYGSYRVHHIHANHTHTQVSKLESPPILPEFLDDTVFERKDDSYTTVRRQANSSFTTRLPKRATTQQLSSALSLTRRSVDESARRNGQRLSRPLRNVRSIRPGTKVGGGTSETDTALSSINSEVRPLLRITEEIVTAAALVAEYESHGDALSKNTSVNRRAPEAGTYWMQGLARKGTVPWGNNASYVVFRNVLDYGAVGDGVTDDTKAINNAMMSGGRCGEKCNGSTTKNAIVYFPPGKYLISSSVLMPFGTQVIGDAINRPTLIASKSFVGLGVLSTDVYTGGNGGAEEYYINTANFYRQIRNVAIDITSAGVDISCLHYQVAQATSLQNVELIASTDPAKNQIGMFAENGSGGQISDVTFTGGNIGLYGGSQQFTAQRLMFRNCNIGVHTIWDWGWVWKSVTMTNVDVGFRLATIDSTGNIGSVTIMDSSFSGIHTAAVVTAPPSENVGSGSTGIVLENVALSGGVKAAVVDTAGKVYLDGSSPVVRSWILGTTYEGNTTNRGFSHGGPVGDYRRNAGLLDSTGAYFERAKPQYQDKSVADFVHIKDLGVTGDGSTDDTAAFQKAVYSSQGQGKILFIDAGSYILTSTINIPDGAKIVGETWSQLVASGSYFENLSKPQVLIKVGDVGSVGSIEMQDLIFTTRGATGGVVLVEWNIQAEQPGSAGLWDCHVRIGGATGTQLTPAECPASTTGIVPGCTAASLMMRITSKASGYFKNMWLWGADHMIDDPDLNDSTNDMVQCTIYVARGLLVESTHPTWLYGTASEHAVLYQYNFQNSASIFAGFLQTETPYYQPTPPPPAPFSGSVGLFPGDPNFACGHGSPSLTGCGNSWSTIIQNSQDLFIASAGVYSWFSTYIQTCIDKQECQGALVLLKNNKANVRIMNLVTIGATNMVVMESQGISAAANLNVNTHPFWSLITVLDVGHDGVTDFKELVWIDPIIWSMEQPAFTCVPPCHIQLPPFPGPTKTVDYPILTVSSGAWTSTVTVPPITISEWVLEQVTIVVGSASVAKRDASVVQGFTAFRPKTTATPYWPAIAYTGPNGDRTTTSPPGPFPTLPGIIVDRDVKPWQGYNDTPIYEPCKVLDFNCIIPPWMMGSGPEQYGDSGDDGDYGDYDDPEDAQITCPISIKLRPSIISPKPSTSSSSTSTTITTTSSQRLMPTGDPRTNRVHCYNSGEDTENQRMLDAATFFCNDMANDNIGPGYQHTNFMNFPYNRGTGYVRIEMALEVFPNCTWKYNLKECQKYLDVPNDSCNCNGIDHKQGGYIMNNCYKWTIDPNREYSS